MAYKIVLQSGEEVGKAFPLEKRTTIGRLSQCEISLKDKGVSREHARLYFQDDILYVADLNSSNGTFLNGKRVSRERVKEGDEIAVGKSSLLVVFVKEKEMSPEEGGGDGVAGLAGEIEVRHREESAGKPSMNSVGSIASEGGELSPLDIHLRDQPLQFSPYKDKRTFSLFSQDLSQRGPGFRVLLIGVVILLFIVLTVGIGLLSGVLFSDEQIPQASGKENKIPGEREQPQQGQPLGFPTEKGPAWRAAPGTGGEDWEKDEEAERLMKELLAPGKNLGEAEEEIWPGTAQEKEIVVPGEEGKLEEIENADEMIRLLEEKKSLPVREGSGEEGEEKDKEIWDEVDPLEEEEKNREKEKREEEGQKPPP